MKKMSLPEGKPTLYPDPTEADKRSEIGEAWGAKLTIPTKYYICQYTAQNPSYH